MGGMGRVYKVYDIKVKERIALKLLKPELTYEEKTVERFRNEIRMSRRIVHKNVCRMFDWGESSHVLYITMEYVPGENLKAIIRLTGPLNVAKTLDYARQICAGLAEAHRTDVIHRDLKPQNIMIDPTGTVRILDFGIARSLQATGWTGDGIAVGTPEYMSPEQVEGQDIDRRTDIYSLGIILYEMVTGRVPFEGGTTLSILRKHELEPPIPPREWNPLIPDSLNCIILKCLEKSKERRFQDADELLQDMNTVKTAAVPIPKTKSRTTAATPPAARPSPITRILGFGLLALFLAAGGYLLLRHKPPKIDEAKSASVSTTQAGLENTLAVLPFEIISVEPRQAEIYRGLADEIRSRLTSIPGLKVLGKYTSELIKDRPKGSEELRAGLKVEKILEGTVQVERPNIRVTVNMTDFIRGPIIWSKIYSENLEGGVFQVADKILGDIASQLNQQLAQQTLDGFKRRETANNEAYFFVRKGQEFEEKYRDARHLEDFRQAVGLYRKALELDPKYIPAYLSLGNVFESRYVQTDSQADLKEMVESYQAAYALDDSMAEVHSGLGWAYFHQHNFDRAYASFKRALQLNPNTAEVILNAGSFLRSIGLYESARKFYARAIDLDPFNYVIYYLAASSDWQIADYDRALPMMKRALDIRPESPRSHLSYARLLLPKDVPGAEKEIASAEALGPLEPELRLTVTRLKALILAIQGDAEKALALIRNDPEPYRYDVTSVLSLVGNKDDAIRYIKKGNKEGFRLVKDYMYPYFYLIGCPYFKNLQSDPRFQAIVQDEKARHEASLKKYGDL